MTLQSLLGLRHTPVAVAYRPKPPSGLRRIEAAAVSGCTYWKLAAEGKSFYTEASDHFGCPIGSFTHNVALPPEKQKELEQMVGTMVGLNYIKMEEVPGIPKRSETFGVALYGPWPGAPFDADVIMVRGTVKQIMMLAEAAHAAGVGAEGAVGLRPTCALLPATIQTQHAGMSLGCIGNRVYTGMDDGDLYFSIPATKADLVLEKLSTVASANRELEKFHKARVTSG